MIEAKDSFKGMYFRYNNAIWCVIKKEAVNVGTHSHTKSKLYIKPVTGGGEKEVVFSHSDKLEDLDISRKSGTLIAINMDSMQVMDSHSYETFNAEASPGFNAPLKEGDEVLFIQPDGKTMIIDKLTKD